MLAWLKTPKKDAPKWEVKRWMAISCIQLMIISTLWVLVLLTCAVFLGKLPNLADFSAILMIFVPSLASIVVKYQHDESKADMAKLNGKEPE